VTTLVCCSVTDLQVCLREIRRVLRPGGGLVFLEHVAAADGTSRRKWQNRINPVWKTFMGNCHLNRETEQAIDTEGFEIIQIERESMRKALPVVRPTIRGIARKPDQRMQSDKVPAV
jgi:ubiquinone/menaquinone biosynthesis C-methylase UbiE